ncbi:MAG TPA: MarR family transcriptional regulator [Anaerolineae bacterium]|nr:MarR family transcriptional regulator [Anaerolineae bacterium]
MAKVSKADYETLAAFRYTLRQFLHFSEEAARKVGLTPQQHQALLAIKGYPGRDYVTIGELAERLQIRHHSAVGLVDRLEAQNFVARQAAEDDRRQVYVQVTSRGLNLLEQLSATHRTELQRVGPQISQLLAQLEISGEEESHTGH